MSILLNRLQNSPKIIENLIKSTGSKNNSTSNSLNNSSNSTNSTNSNNNNNNNIINNSSNSSSSNGVIFKQPIRARQLFSFSELVGTDLTLLLEESIILRVLSYFDYTELFILKRVCSRWKPLAEHKSLYTQLHMQSFIVNCRILPIPILRTFISNLSMNTDEIDAIKMVCRDMPPVSLPVLENLTITSTPTPTPTITTSTNQLLKSSQDDIIFNKSHSYQHNQHNSYNSSNSISSNHHANHSHGHLRVSSVDESYLTTSNSSSTSASSLQSSNDYYSTSPLMNGSQNNSGSGGNTPNAQRKNQDKELKRKEKQRKEREKRMEESVKVWNEDIIPNWDKRKDSKKVRDLVFQGIPSLVRSKVWPLLIGNDLNITPELFTIFGARAERAKQKSESSSLGREGSVSLIHLDLPRTFPMLSIFQQEGPLHQSLANVLEAYVCYRPDVGYVQGMSYLGALFLLILDEFTSFVCLSNLLNNPCYMSFYTMNLQAMEVYMKAMDSLMQQHLPKVHRHLKDMGIQPDVFMIDWVLTIFSKALPLDLASHVWDNIFMDGEIVIFQTALGILKLYSKELESADFDVCMTLLTHLPPDIDDDDLFQSISSFNINQKNFNKMIGKSD
ncbi:RabGAP/TBC domain-containing protein [Tieghemostelium lacteum]|uniref:RabGAP/TBC domain-containing protein n=1 Tax=Tieghemostelium lacteum TaxID=361077 RepID=A0A151ZC84_TIELA|nr:RabGAP/TBC domain-containing protein [Tieghemostelium lacteum]|eukprot:KYQ91551.1 RabGAP/TBC domain-containing protein [Tieghemostelium lacteum]